MPSLSEFGDSYPAQMLLAMHDGLPYAVWPLEALNDNMRIHITRGAKND